MKNQVDKESYWEFVRLLIPFSDSLDDEKSSLSFSQIYGTPSIDVDPSNRLFNSNSLLLNGITDYLRYSHDEETEIGNADFTLEFWFKPTIFGSSKVGSYQNKRIIFSSNTVYDPSLGDTIQIFLDDDEITFIISNVTIEQEVVTKATLNKWHHIAVTRENDILRYYVDGFIIQEVEGVDFNITTRNFMLGGASPTTNANQVGYFSGNISNFRFTKGFARYDDNFSTPTEKYNVGNTPRTPTNFFPTIWLDPVNGAGDSSFALNEMRIQNISQAPSLNEEFIDGRESYLFSGSSMSSLNEQKYIINDDDFTIESWVNLPNVNGNHALVGSYGWGRRNFTFGVFNGRLGAYWHRTNTQYEGRASNRNRSKFGFFRGRRNPEDEPLFNFNDGDDGKFNTGPNNQYDFNGDADYKGILKNNTWHHIAWTRKDGLNRMFLDGKIVANFTSPYDNWSADCITFGKRQYSVYALRLIIASSGIGGIWRWVNQRYIHREKWSFFGYASDILFSNLVCKYDKEFKPKLIAVKDRMAAHSFLDQNFMNIEDFDERIAKSVTAKKNGDNIFWFNDESGFVLNKPGSNNNGALISKINRSDSGDFSINSNTARTYNLSNIDSPIPVSNVSGVGILDTFDKETLTYKDVVFDSNTTSVELSDSILVRPNSVFETGKSAQGMVSLYTITDFNNTHRQVVNSNWTKIRYNTIANNTAKVQLSSDGTITLKPGRYYISVMSSRRISATAAIYYSSRIRNITENKDIAYSIGGIHNHATVADRIDTYLEVLSDTEINIEHKSSASDSQIGLSNIGYQLHQQCTIYKVGI